MSQARVKPGLPQLDRPPGRHCCHLAPWLHCHHPFGDFGQLSSWSPPPALARGPTFVSLSVRSMKCGLDPAACFCLSGTEVKDGGLRLGYERFHSPREAGHHPGSSSIGCPGPALCRVSGEPRRGTARLGQCPLFHLALGRCPDYDFTGARAALPTWEGRGWCSKAAETPGAWRVKGGESTGFWVETGVQVESPC